MKTIVIAGGKGFLGQVLEAHFKTKGYKVRILTRTPDTLDHIYWDGQNLGQWTKQLEHLDVLINLSGRSVDCRYTESNKKDIYDSRIDTTELLGLAINLCDHPPKLWINSSTATIYRGSRTRAMTEKEGEIGSDFSMNIAKSWENAFFNICNPKTRKIALRTAIVLGKKGGALQPLKWLTLLGLGGKQGTGDQMVSWIHETDFARAVEFLIHHKQEGVFNLSVPSPIPNRSFMQNLRRMLGIPFGLPQPKWLLEFGARLIRTETELILKSRNVIPERLLESGFHFIYPSIQTALYQLIKAPSQR